MERKNKMRDIVRAMSGVLNVPLTIKMRTGVQDGNPVAHKIIPELRSWGAEMVTVRNVLLCSPCSCRCCLIWAIGGEGTA